MSEDDEATITTLDHSSDSNDESMSPPDYYKIWSLQDAADSLLIDSKFPGVRLLNERANNQRVELADQRRINAESKREWSVLQKVSKKRSKNLSEAQLSNLRKVRCVYLLLSNIFSHYVTKEINNQIKF